MSSRRPRPDQQDFTLLEQTRTRLAIGERTLQSVTQKPHFWMSVEVDATAVVAARTGLKESGAEVVPSYNDFLLKTVALILPDNPRFNSWRVEEGLHVLEHINVGFAVATEQGVLLPTLMDADKKSLAEIAQEARELVDLARTGKLRATLQMGAGFTVSNIGPEAVDAFSGVISPPQTGILAVGAMKQRAVVADGEVVARATMICTLSIDHAAADGADGAKFLGDLQRSIEDPEFLADL